MKVAFLHPDLGIGGAERLIVDAAVGLARLGHDVTIFTSHYDSKHSFSETRMDLFKVRVFGDEIPRHFRGQFHIFGAILRNLYLANSICNLPEKYDVFIVDQVSASIPILRLRSPDSGIVFYGHFPDSLLSQRTSILKKIYRFPFDTFEEATTALTDTLLVNSLFTKKKFIDTFRLLRNHNSKVLYPCITIDVPEPSAPSSDPVIFLSLNRFERKKDIKLAIEATARFLNAHHFRSKASSKPSSSPRVHLFVVGGYDPRVAENVEHYLELVALAERLGLIGDSGLKSDSSLIRKLIPDWVDQQSQQAISASKGTMNVDRMQGSEEVSFKQVEVGEYITFVRSCSDEQKRLLLSAASSVIYTPTNEHFGIVPLECMLNARPVIACASGGPLESVIDGKTGFLCSPTAESFYEAMNKIYLDPKNARKMGKAGRVHVSSTFSRDHFAQQLEKIAMEVSTPDRVRAKRETHPSGYYWFVLFSLFFWMLIIMIILLWIGKRILIRA